MVIPTGAPPAATLPENGGDGPRWSACWRGAQTWAGAAARWKGARRVLGAAEPRRGALGPGRVRERARRDRGAVSAAGRAIFPAVCAACPRLWRANGAPRAPAALRDPTHGCWGPIAPLGAPRSGQFAEVCRHPSSDVE
jgi:hypothetical protein